VFAGPWCGVSTALHVYCCTQGGCVPLRVDSRSAIYRIIAYVHPVVWWGYGCGVAIQEASPVFALL